MRWPAVIASVHTVIICVFIPERSPCASCNRKGFLCQDRTGPSKHHGWPGAASPSRSILDAISIHPAPEPDSGLREGQIYASELRVHTYLTPSAASDTHINDTQVVLVPSAKFGHFRLFPSSQAPTPGLTFPHCQGAPEFGCLCPGTELSNMGI
jgi:hypothetical protein